MGRGDVRATDRRVEAMHRTFKSIAINGVIAISEGMRRSTTCSRSRARGQRHRTRIDVALDPLEGAAICATGATRPVHRRLAERGGFLQCPEMHMEKIAVA